MDTTTATTLPTIGTITIRGREFTVQGPTPSYRTYLLTGARGATYIAVQAYIGDEHTFKVLGGRYWTHELRIAGNLVRLTDDRGPLREVQRTHRDGSQTFCQHNAYADLCITCWPETTTIFGAATAAVAS